MNTIAIDCGASFIKGALFRNHLMIKSTQRQSPPVHGEGGILAPVQIKALLSLVEDLLSELSELAGESFRLCISNEMHGFLLADANGTPCTDYISWQKEYGYEKVDGISAVEILSASELSEEILHTGMPVRAGLPSCNLLYMAKKGLLRTYSEPLYFYTLGDYLIRFLSGRQPLCHPTNAAATGLYDLSRSAWNEKIIRTVSGTAIRFPEVGTAAMAFVHGGHKVSCLPAIGDQQAALLGAGVAYDSDISFNLGTGAQVSRLTDKLQFSTDFQTRPYFRNHYLMSVPHLPSGRALNVYFRFFKDVLTVFGVPDKRDEEIWEVLLREEARCPSSDLQCDLSFFQTPLTDHRVGSIGNIGEYALCTGTLMKSVLCQMGDNFISVADKLEPDRSKIRRVVFSGGIARRITSLRTYILRHYAPDKACFVAEEETLIGLDRYGDSMA